MRNITSSTLVISLALLALALCQSANAGKLGGARAAVRQSASPPAPKPEKTKSSKQDSKSGKLSKARREVRQSQSHRSTPPTAPRPPRPSRRRPRNHGHCMGPMFSSWCFDAPVYSTRPGYATYTYLEPPIYESVTPQFVAPAPTLAAPCPPTICAPAEPITPELRTCFSRFPYANGAGGFLDLQPLGCTKDLAGMVRFEYGGDFDGLTRQGVGFMLEGVSGWGVDFKWDSYRESLSGGGYDELHIGDFNAMYRVVQTDRSLVRVGLGVNWLGDAVGANAGFNMTMKADFAPVQPLVFSTELDFGTLGDAEMLHGAATVGIVTERLELFGGYDYRRIGQVELQGPMVGLRLWF